MARMAGRTPPTDGHRKGQISYNRPIWNTWVHGGTLQGVLGK